jgi:glucans biosynthesis protein C
MAYEFRYFPAYQTLARFDDTGTPAEVCPWWEAQPDPGPTPDGRAEAMLDAIKEIAIMAIAESALLPTSPPRSVPNSRPRLAYLDSLKVLLTALVIAHHAGQPYGPTGGRWPIFEPERAAILGPFFSVNAAFFMGLFFLISAYLLPASFDRHGALGVLRDRGVRFGLPIVVFGIGIFGPIGYLDYASHGGSLAFLPYMAQVYIGQWRVEIAQLWFVAHLLVYFVLYAVWRTLRPTAGSDTRLPAPSNAMILTYTVVLAGVTFLVRTAFPVDRWVNLLPFVPVEPAHLPQYASLFAIGLVAARHNWLLRLPTATGLTWLSIGLAAAILRYLPTGLPFPAGGLSAEALLRSTWEAFICVGLVVGLPVLLREHLSGPNWLSRVCAPLAYGAYVVHVLPVVVGLQFALAGMRLDALAKFALVTLVGVPLSFLFAAALRRLPGVRSVL